MSLFGRHTNPRRREVRRTIDKPQAPWLQTLMRRDVVLALLHVAGFTLIAGLIALIGRQQVPYREGQPVTRPYYARVEFKSIDKEATERKLQIAQAESPSFFKAKTEYFHNWLQGKLDSLMALVKDNKTADQVPDDVRKQFLLTDQTLVQLRDFVDESNQPNERWKQLVTQITHAVASRPVLATPDHKREQENPSPQILVQLPGGDTVAVFDTLTYSANDAKYLSNVSLLLEEMPQLRFRRQLHASIMAILSGRELTETYTLDPEETARLREAAVLAVTEEMKQYTPNTLVVDTTPRQALAGINEVRRYEEADLKLIREERAAYEASLQPWKRLLRNGGIIGVVLVGGIAFWVYIAAYYPRVTLNPMRGLAIAALALLAQAAAYGLLMALGPERTYVAAVFPTLLASVILAIAYDQRFALSFGILHALLVTLTLNLPLGFALVLLLGVAATVVQLREVRTRSKLVIVGMVSGTAMALGVVLVGFIDRPLHIHDETWRIIVDALRVWATGCAIGFVVQGILPGIERIFKVSTAMTLKDLSDFSHPLLRRLAERAPGTWRHSLALADMAESAANAINADGLLCRVGAMYHDIGKLNKPMYFVENQGGGPNRHDKLSPAMSVLIIVGHVKDGVEMAREYRLPALIRHFIESHHGTTLVEYFYHAARKQKEADDQPLPSEFEFRYPGPKPQTREAAIIMLCDGVEGAARTMPDPMPARLEQLVHHMAMKRLMDGQFSECNLTLEELHRIEEAVTKALCAMYHGRIAYPSDDREQPSKSDGEAEPHPAPAIAS